MMTMIITSIKFTYSLAAYRCEAPSMAIADGNICCRRQMLRSDHPGCPIDGYMHPFLHFEDPKECCYQENAEECPGVRVGNVCLNHPPGSKKSELSLNFVFIFFLCYTEQSICPSDRPFSFYHGLKCCRFHARSSQCAAGPERSTLEKTDGQECCINDDHVECVSEETGNNAICKNHEDSDSECRNLHI